MALVIVSTYVIILAIVLIWATAFSSGASGVGSTALALSEARVAAREHAPESCKPAAKAIRFYSARTHYWQARRGGQLAERIKWPTCSWARYAAEEWQARATAAKRKYVAWVAYHWHWWKWLPDKWARIGACETGYGTKPGVWTWNSGRFQGAFGFYYGTWDQYRPAGAPSEAYLATPRQQYQAALNVAAVHGYGAWGCGGA